MTCLFQPAEVDRVAILIADDEPYDFRIERAAFLEIADGQDDMACARDVERRFVLDGWQHPFFSMSSRAVMPFACEGRLRSTSREQPGFHPSDSGRRWR